MTCIPVQHTKAYNRGYHYIIDAEDWKELRSLDMPERVSLVVICKLEAYGIRVPRKLGVEGASISL